MNTGDVLPALVLEGDDGWTVLTNQGMDLARQLGVSTFTVGPDGSIHYVKDNKWHVLPQEDLPSESATITRIK